MTNAEREKIIKRVKALMQFTIERGCSEEEALAAMAKVNELMEEYDLSFKDLEAEVRDERYGARKRTRAGGTARRRTWHEVTNCNLAVAAYWDCKSWRDDADQIFFGSASDTEAAHAMIDMLQLAMDREWGRYLVSADRDARHHGRTLRASFMTGMAIRINERLRQMKAERSQANAPRTGAALVVVKTAVVTEKFAAYSREHGLRLVSSGGSGRSVNSEGAFNAGKAAGGRVDLGGGKIGGGSAPRIGR